MWCVGQLDDEYIERMEDVLELYQKPYDARRPVICIDEKSIQLLEDSRPTIVAHLPGEITKRDYEYIRRGTANIFCIIEPKTGRRLNKVTKRRTRKDFARMLARIAELFPDAKSIHLVMDNLNTHTVKSLIETFGRKKAFAFWKRFQIHYTPKHASWLNQAEIEVNLISQRCIGKQRVPDQATLSSMVVAWNRRNRTPFQWNFTKKQARKKFGYKSGKTTWSRH